MGTSTLKGGVIGVVAHTEKHINSIHSLMKHAEEKQSGCFAKIRALGAGLCMLIGLKLRWPIDTLSRGALEKKLRKASKKDSGGAMLRGIDTARGTPWASHA